MKFDFVKLIAILEALLPVAQTVVTTVHPTSPVAAHAPQLAEAAATLADLKASVAQGAPGVDVTQGGEETE